MTKKIVFDCQYDYESLIDLPADLMDYIDSEGEVPRDSNGMLKGTFNVVVTWEDDDEA